MQYNIWPLFAMYYRVAWPLSVTGQCMLCVCVRCARCEWASKSEGACVRTCGQWMNGRGKRSERSSRSSDSNKVNSIVCSLDVNKGDCSSRYSKAPWYYFPTSFTSERGSPRCKHILRLWRKSSPWAFRPWSVSQIELDPGVIPCCHLTGCS